MSHRFLDNYSKLFREKSSEASTIKSLAFTTECFVRKYWQGPLQHLPKFPLYQPSIHVTGATTLHHQCKKQQLQFPKHCNQWIKKAITYSKSIHKVAWVDQIKYEGNPSTEDRLVVTNMKNGSGVFLAVFDGHGGASVAEDASKHIYDFFQKRLAQNLSNSSPKQAIENALKQAFKDVQDKCFQQAEVTRKNKKKYRRIGSCALCLVVTKDSIVTANAGDSKAILISDTGQTTDLNHMLNTSLESQQKRLVSILHRLREEFSDEDILVVNQKNGASYLKGCLIPTRCFGDFHMKHKDFANGILKEFNGPYITHEPEIITITRQSKYYYLVAGSDGLWDQLGNEEVSKLVRDAKNNSQRPNCLLEAALERVAEKNEATIDQIRKLSPGKRREFHDDISIIVADLKQYV